MVVIAEFDRPQIYTKLIYVWMEKIKMKENENIFPWKENKSEN